MKLSWNDPSLKRELKPEKVRNNRKDNRISALMCSMCVHDDYTCVTICNLHVTRCFSLITTCNWLITCSFVYVIRFVCQEGDMLLVRHMPFLTGSVCIDGNYGLLQGQIFNFWFLQYGGWWWDQITLIITKLIKSNEKDRWMSHWTSNTQPVIHITQHDHLKINQ